MAPGDRVIFGVRPGAFAEYVRVTARRPPDAPARQAGRWPKARASASARRPPTIRWSIAPPLKQGEVLLVHGASGGVGLAAVQLGKHLGATVIATGSDDARLAVVQAERRRPRRSTTATADFVAAVKELTGGQGADVIYDPVGGEVLEKSMRAAAYGARLLVVGFTSGGPSKIMSNHVLIKGLSVLGVRAGETIRAHSPELGRDYVERVAAGSPRSA